MELVLLGVLAAAGYELSKGGKAPRDKPPPPVPKSFTQPSLNTVVSTNPNAITVPFYSSKTYGDTTSDTYNRNTSHVMETFTGTSDVVFSHKRECENMFKPQKNLTNINGSQLLLNETNRSDRYTTSVTNQMHNVAPAPKEYVGPGLNIDSSQPATGGFHDTFRILPDNIGGYKKNSFGGRVVSGKGVTTNRTAPVAIQDNEKPERFFTEEQRPAAAGRAQHTAIASRGQYDINPTSRGVANEFIGGLGGANGFEQRQGSTRDYDSTKCYDVRNVHQQGVATYDKGVYSMGHTQRENCSVATNLSGQHAATLQYTDGAAPTQREMAHNHNGHVHNSAVVTGGHNAASYSIDPTSRELTSRDYCGTARATVDGHATQHYTAPLTSREGTSVESVGPAGGKYKAQTTQTFARNASPYYQREELGVEHTPGAGRMNIIEDPMNVMPNAEFANDTNTHTVQHGQGVVQSITRNALGSIEHAPKIQEANPRSDFAIAKDQLSSNPYAPMYFK